MKKFFTLTIMLITTLMVFSCFDDTDDDCEETPLFCDQTQPTKGTLNFNVTIDDDNTSVVVDLRSGGDYDTGNTVELITLTTTGGSRYINLGEYSAMVSYTVNYNGKTYKIEAVDGADLTFNSENYCDGITCYEEDSETLDLEFDRAAFIEKLEGSGKDCFIATAAYGSGSAWQVDYLRSFRDSVLKKSDAGRYFIKQYYVHSPAAAEFISVRPAVRYSVRLMLSAVISAMMHPFVSSASVIGIVMLKVYGTKARRRKRIFTLKPDK